MIPYTVRNFVHVMLGRFERGDTITKDTRINISPEENPTIEEMAKNAQRDIDETGYDMEVVRDVIGKIEDRAKPC